MIDNPYFSHKELECKSTGIVQLAPGFLDYFVDLREAYGRPMRVNSCCRSAKHNNMVGGNPRSLHVYDKPAHNTGGTCAIDIHMENAHEKAMLVKLALNMGWSVGVAKTFLHLDRRDIAGLPQACFTY